MTPVLGPFTPDQLPMWFQERLAGLNFPLGWKPGCPDPEGWAKAGREAFRRVLLQERREVPFAGEVIASEGRDGYRVVQLEFSVGPAQRTEALLAIPDGPGPFPAALVLHDHGALFALGKEKVLRGPAGTEGGDQAEAWTKRCYDGRFIGDELARRGWVVLAADALGWGSRACGGYEAQQAVASNLFNLGSSWAGLIVSEDEAAAGYLASRPEVDARRLCAVGFSFGAMRAWQLHGLSDHVRATVAVCGFGTLGGLMVSGGHRARGQSAWATTHPGLAQLMDFPDVAALGAPKPLLMVHGREDRLFPMDCVAAAYQKVRDVYAGFGKPEAFRGEFRPGGHVFTIDDQNLAWDWLDHTLAPGQASAVLS